MFVGESTSLIAGVRGKIDPLLRPRIAGITSRQGKQMLGLQEYKGGRLRLHVRLLRLDHEERYVRLFPAAVALGYHPGHLL